MPESYTRQSSFSNGDVIDAPLFIAEFDQLEAAFGETSGHNHDGTVGAGAPVPLIKKGTTSISIDTTDPSDHKIVFTLDGVVIREFTEASGDSLADTSALTHTPSGDVEQPLNTYLDSLEVAVGDASIDAASAAASAAAAASYAATVGVPTIVVDGGSFVIAEDQAAIEIVCLGSATITFPTAPAVLAKYVVKSTDKNGVVTGILGAGHQISDSDGVLHDSFTVEGLYQLDAHWLGAGVYRGF